MKVILFDDPVHREFLKPLVLTRPVAELRCGIYTIAEKWSKYLGLPVSYLTEEYLQKKFPCHNGEINCYISAHCMPSPKLVDDILALEEGVGLYAEGSLVAYKTKEALSYGFKPTAETLESKVSTSWIKELPHLFLLNGAQIKSDYLLFTKGKKSAEILDPFTAQYAKDQIFVGQDVSVKAAILNAEGGPIILDEGAIVQEGAILVGPTYIGKNSMVAFGAKIRNNTSLGPNCRVGGEVGNSIFHAYSNKAHDGFLGNSYIGAWCNLGANTNNSNLKNNYKSVSIHTYATGALYDTKEIFCGTFLGDYTKVGISTMFNTGTVVGVSSNIYGAGFQSKYVPSFSWGGAAEGYESYTFSKAIEVIKSTMARKDLELSEEEENILAHISKGKV